MLFQDVPDPRLWGPMRLEGACQLQVDFCEVSLCRLESNLRIVVAGIRRCLALDVGFSSHEGLKRVSQKPAGLKDRKDSVTVNHFAGEVFNGGR